MAANFELTAHATVRARQRGLREDDLRAILEYGTETAEGIILLERDVQRYEQQVRKKLSRLHALVGGFVATSGETATTAFRATKRQRRRFIEHAQGSRKLKSRDSWDRSGV